jgi:protein-tyrosine phosphatase
MMIPLADLHCHLLAGLDDGPRTPADALAMCRQAYEEGTRLAAATAHQNERWREVTPDRIRAATQELRRQLHEAGVPLTVFPCGEVMARIDLERAWAAGELLSVADQGQYLLLEMPHGLFVDLRPLVKLLQRAGVRLILAHPERQPGLLHDTGVIEELIAAGCLVQVSSGSITDPPTSADRRALESWVRRGCVHLLGSDGHSPGRRPPRMADAYRQIARWAGAAVADRVCSTNGMAVLHGLPLRVAPPEPVQSRWFPRLW